MLFLTLENENYIQDKLCDDFFYLLFITFYNAHSLSNFPKYTFSFKHRSVLLGCLSLTGSNFGSGSGRTGSDVWPPNSTELELQRSLFEGISVGLVKVKDSHKMAKGFESLNDGTVYSYIFVKRRVEIIIAFWNFFPEYKGVSFLERKG